MAWFTPAIPYIIGAISAATGIYTIVKTEQAGKDAQAIADQNARLKAIEGERRAAVMEKDKNRQLARAIAMAYASGATGESHAAYINDLRLDLEEDIRWVRAGSSIESQILKEEGEAAHQEASARAVGMMGDLATGQYDWWVKVAG